MPRFKEQAVCIRLIDFSETSQVVWLFTEGLGLVRGLAKGSKRTSPGSVAKYSGGFELLTAGQAVGVTKSTSDLAVLTEWDLQRPYHQFRRSLGAQRLGLYAADVVGAIMAEGDAHRRTYDALLGFYDAIGESSDAGDWGEALLRFQWELLDDAGYRLELERDVRTDKEISGKRKTYMFDARGGGFTCEAVAGGDDVGVWRVRVGTVELLRGLGGDRGTDGGGFHSDKSRGSTHPTGQGASDRGRNVSGSHTASRDTADRAMSVERANRLLCVYIRAILDRELPTMKVVLGE